MIESSSQSLEREKVAYLLISGQAAVRSRLRGSALLGDDHVHRVGRPADHRHQAPEVEERLREHPEAEALCEPPPLRRFATAASRGLEADDATRLEVERWLAERIPALRQSDREYWRPVMAELRELRASGWLVPVGTAVTSR